MFLFPWAVSDGLQNNRISSFLLVFIRDGIDRFAYLLGDNAEDAVFYGNRVVRCLDCRLHNAAIHYFPIRFLLFHNTIGRDRVESLCWNSSFHTSLYPSGTVMSGSADGSGRAACVTGMEVRAAPAFTTTFPRGTGRWCLL